MALNVGLDVLFDEIQDWKGTRQKAGEVKGEKSYTSDETSR
jgi:hypothetical protein